MLIFRIFKEVSGTKTKTGWANLLLVKRSAIKIKLFVWKRTLYMMKWKFISQKEMKIMKM